MAQQVKIKTRVGRPLRFPGLCVHCTRPAGDHMTIRRRLGRVTRLIDVPLCGECAAEVRQLSAEEERLLRLGRVVTAVILVVGLIIGWLFLGSLSPVWLRLLLAVSLAAIGATAVRRIFQRARARAVRPEKQAILQAAQIVTFSWRATTFAFVNEAFATTFATLNESLLMEI